MASCSTINNRSSMTLQSQLEQRKYRNWVKAGLGLKYVKEGLETFCDEIVNEIHDDIKQKVGQQYGQHRQQYGQQYGQHGQQYGQQYRQHGQQYGQQYGQHGQQYGQQYGQHGQQYFACGNCHFRTLLPNHVRMQNRQCPLAMVNCNCQIPGGKGLCPNNVCGKIMDQIILQHASTPPAPSWRNTDVSRWCADPWAVAVCYINVPGYDNKTNASEIDTAGLLQLIINNKTFHEHIQCQISGQDVFSRVRQHRNDIMHSHAMELENTKTISIINDMIALLQDGEELVHRRESQEAVQKLLQLKQEDFIMTTRSEVEVVTDLKLAITLKQQELKETMNEANFQMDLKRAEFMSEVDARLKELDERLKVMNEAHAESENRRATVNNDVVGATNDEASMSGTTVEIDNRSMNNVSTENRYAAHISNFHFHECNVQIMNQQNP